jgi:hypothetical protein
MKKDASSEVTKLAREQVASDRSKRRVASRAATFVGMQDSKYISKRKANAYRARYLVNATTETLRDLHHKLVESGAYSQEKAFELVQWIWSTIEMRECSPKRRGRPHASMSHTHSPRDYICALAIHGKALTRTKFGTTRLSAAVSRKIVAHAFKVVRKKYPDVQGVEVLPRRMTEAKRSAAARLFEGEMEKFVSGLQPL